MTEFNTRAGTNDRVKRAIAAIRRGSPVVIVDEDVRESGGFLVFGAEHATTAMLAFVIRHTSGFVCVALPAHDCDRLDLPPMLHGRHGDGSDADYRVTVDLVGGGTGISQPTEHARLQLSLRRLPNPGTSLDRDMWSP